MGNSSLLLSAKSRLNPRDRENHVSSPLHKTTNSGFSVKCNGAIERVVDVMSEVEDRSLDVYNEFSILVGGLSSKMSGEIGIFLALRTISKKRVLLLVSKR